MNAPTAFYPMISVTSNNFKWMNGGKWAEAPAYHSTLPWQALLVAGVCALMIVLVTIVLRRLTPAATATSPTERAPGNSSEVFQYA